MRKFDGRVAVITGAASGIGLALCKAFYAQGMKLVMADIEKDALDKAVSLLSKDPDRVVGVLCDVSDADSVDNLAKAALESFGAVHLVCNNAGVVTGGPSWEQTHEQWEWVLGVNLWGVINGIRSFVPILLEQDEAHIVNTASMAGLVALPMATPYTVTKHAVVGLSESLLLELEIIGSTIGVSVLCPGWVKTSLVDAQRNKPAYVRTDTSQEVGAFTEHARDLMQTLIGNGMDPDTVAGQVVDAVSNGRFWIHTHQEMKGAISARFKRCVESENPQLALEGLVGGNI